MTNTSKATLAVILATSIASFAGSQAVNSTAQTSTSTDQLVSGTFEVGVASGYISKGREIDTHPVIQPSLSLSLPTGLDFGGTKSSVVLTTKQNLHTHDPLSVWWRSESNAGISITKDRFTFVPTYEIVSSPENKFKRSSGVNLGVSFDDSGLTPLALNPHATVYLGVEKNGLDNKGTSYEVGISPSTTVGTTKVSLPVNLGLGSNNFYSKNDRYGYSSVGIETSTPIYKNVSLKTGVTYFNTNENSNRGKNDLWLTSAGVSVSF